MVKKRVNLDNEDLWNIVTKTIIPKKSDKISPVNFLIGDMNKKINKSESKKKNKKVYSQSSLQPALQTLKVVKNIPSDLRYEEAIGIDGTSSKKLRAGKFNVEAKLDLHGMSQHNAFLNLQTFIKKSFSNQYRTILIITGKGKEGTGVLRSKLPVWLKSDFCSPYILAFGQAKEKDGGSGAFYIRLRRNRSQS